MAKAIPLSLPYVRDEKTDLMFKFRASKKAG
jgi:hypothetical protein